MSEDQTNHSWWEKVTYSWQNCRRFFLTPLCALLALCGFIIPWIGSQDSGTNVSGWQMALNETSKDLFFLPGVPPGALIALWLVPATALVLFSAGSARLLWVSLCWLRIWGWILVGLCLVLMSGFCFPLLSPHAWQYLRFGNLQMGFWLTGGALLLSALGLLFPDPLWWIRDTRQQPAPEAQGVNTPRRRLLGRALNLGGMLVVACAVGLDLGWFSRPHVTSYRVLSLRALRASSFNGEKALVWSPDNASLLECLSGVLRSWKIATSQVTRTYLFPHLSVGILEEENFNSIALSPDGRWLAAAIDNEGIILWETASGRFVNRFTNAGQNSQPLPDLLYGGVAWSPDSLLLTTSMFTTENQTALFILRASDLQEQAMYPLSSVAQAVAWSPNGRMIAMAIFATSTVEVWDVFRNKKIWAYQSPSITLTFEGQTSRSKARVTDIAWASDSQRLAISLGNNIDDQGTPVLIWNIVENRQVGSCQGHWQSTNGLAWSPDGTRIAAGGDDWTVQVWNAQTQQRLLIYQGHRNSVLSVAWSPDGTYLASGSSDQTIQVWQAPQLS